MQNYLQLAINVNPGENREILIARLAELGFEAFEEEKEMLKAFIPENDFPGSVVHDLLQEASLRYQLSTIVQKNWNEAWESGFEPVIVEDFCVIRAEFHDPMPGMKHEIIITPKMSFGTGHHATTYMMVQAMEHIPFTSKRVFDFGTGTGVLAILAEQSGASCITAIDNDDWSIENAAENITRNHCEKIQLVKAEFIEGSTKFDLILANINRHVIINNLDSMKVHLEKGGSILLSGLLESDLSEITHALTASGLIIINSLTRHNWICLQCVTTQ